MKRAALMENVIITDVTLREFGQNVPEIHLHRFTPEIRTRVALKLIDLGFSSIEVLSCVHPRIAPAMHTEALRTISAAVGRTDKTHMITLVPNSAGYRTFRSLDLGPDGFNHTMGVFFSGVEAHNRLNIGKSIEESIADYRTILEDAARRHIRVVGYVSAAFGYRMPETGRVIRPDFGDINRYVDFLFDLGARTVTLSDLQGVADKDETVRILEAILDMRKGKNADRIGYHPHHVSGDQALINSKAAFGLGIRRFDASLGGTGGCVTGAPGNQPTERLVQLFSAAGIETGIEEMSVSALTETVRKELYEKIPLARSLPGNKGQQEEGAGDGDKG